tara:strand:- start:5049 stop:5816 length:768 start_codon:yes stop_codon:yes gene_type:complete
LSKKITIIIATYNASSTLKRCLDSLLVQKTSECELVIIDGGSSDSTVEIIKSFGDEVDVFISEPDDGIYDAWNKGIKASQGNWIMFIGADDQLFPNALSNYLNLLSSSKVDAKVDYICGKNMLLDDNGNVLKIFGESPNWNRLKKNMVAAHVGSLHNRRSLFSNVDPFNTKFKICADYELLLSKGKNLSFYFYPVQIAKMTAGGMSFSLKAIYETFIIRRDLKSLPAITNVFITLLNIIAFYAFLIRKRVLGFKI